MRGSRELGRQRVRRKHDQDTLYTCMEYLKHSIYRKRRKDNIKESSEVMKHKNHSLAMLI